MNNYKLLVQYDGSRYNGWQRQNDTDNTIQQILGDRVNCIVGEAVKVIGSGRTDAGVHALAQCANFRCRRKLDEEVVTQQLNESLPDDIKILEMIRVPLNFHARHSAVGKRYVYRIDCGTVQNPFERRYSWRVETPLDIGAMKRAANVLIGKHDFAGFCTDAKSMPYTVKTLESILFMVECGGVKQPIDAADTTAFRGGGYPVHQILALEFYAKGFLYNMVRILAGTLVDVGLEKYTDCEVKQMLLDASRQKTGQLAPAKGLFLKEVDYEPM